MHEDLSEQLLYNVMKWDPQRIVQEGVLLKILATCKYDHYEQFRPGRRFIESLALWLKQFPQTSREDAYSFIKQRLIFISGREIHHLVVSSYPHLIKPLLIEMTAKVLGVSSYRTSTIIHSQEFKELNRKCLYLGLSDGACVDIFRRGNGKEVNNEQILGTYQMSSQKALGLKDKLTRSLHSIRTSPKGKTTLRVLTDRRPTNSAHESWRTSRGWRNLFTYRTFKSPERFKVLVLLDDFNGSGSSLIRSEEGKLTGKLPRIIEELTVGNKELSGLVDRRSLEILVVFYISTQAGKEQINSMLTQLRHPSWIRISLHIVQEISDEFKVSNTLDKSMCALIDSPNHYDESASQDEHLKKGGTDNVRYGFARCALPVVLGHNTPNNSVFLLWANEEDFRGARGLFPRVPRHRGE